MSVTESMELGLFFFHNLSSCAHAGPVIRSPRCVICDKKHFGAWWPASCVKGVVDYRRISHYWAKWKALARDVRRHVLYCHEEAATSIDHVLPYSYADIDELDNLRPACALCNAIAG